MLPIGHARYFCPGKAVREVDFCQLFWTGLCIACGRGLNWEVSFGADVRWTSSLRRAAAAVRCTLSIPRPAIAASRHFEVGEGCLSRRGTIVIQPRG